jgi:hypothetical protein
MTTRELDADRLLGALGELHRTERSELARLDEQAQELAAREPERAQALEDRLMDELFVAKPAPLSAAVSRSSPPKPRLRRTVQLASAAAFSCAMAAAALLWVRAPEAQPFAVSYTLVPPSSDATTRSVSQATSPGVFSLGRTLTFALRPAVRYEGALSVVCYAAQERAVIRLHAQVELDPAGGARVAIPADTLTQAVRKGSWELLFYVAPPSAAGVSESQVRDRQCPSDTRCLTYAARFVQPEDL